jgi:hypothetical protein
MPHQQAQALAVAHNPQKALADCGVASLYFAPWETLPFFFPYSENLLKLNTHPFLLFVRYAEIERSKAAQLKNWGTAF